MTKTLVPSEEKIQKISDALRMEVLHPAQKEAEQILEDAVLQAEQIKARAQEEAEELLNQAHKRIEQEKSVFKSSLDQAAKQSLETLRIAIENELFNKEFSKEIEKGTQDADSIGKLLKALIKALGKEGMDTELVALIPNTVDPEAVAKHLGKTVIDKLKEKELVVGGFEGGVKVKLEKKNMTLDISDKTFKELLLRYVRKDFRKLIFKQD